MFTIKKLNSIPYGQVKTRNYDNGDIDLISYSTVVATVRNGWLTINGLYSATTRKHISAFMREYDFGTYALAKQIYNDSVKYNIFTGEIVG